MKAKPMRQETGDNGNLLYRPCESSEATHIKLNVPGPWPYRIIPVVLGNATRKGTPCWSWNGDVEKPTLKPSIRTTDGVQTCHSFVTDGKIQFLSDCTHEFAGQTVDLLDIEQPEEPQDAKEKEEIS